MYVAQGGRESRGRMKSESLWGKDSTGQCSLAVSVLCHAVDVVELTIIIMVFPIVPRRRYALRRAYYAVADY